MSNTSGDTTTATACNRFDPVASIRGLTESMRLMMLLLIGLCCVLVLFLGFNWNSSQKQDNGGINLQPILEKQNNIEKSLEDLARLQQDIHEKYGSIPLEVVPQFDRSSFSSWPHMKYEGFSNLASDFMAYTFWSIVWCAGVIAVVGAAEYIIDEHIARNDQNLKPILFLNIVIFISPTFAFYFCLFVQAVLGFVLNHLGSTALVLVLPISAGIYKKLKSDDARSSTTRKRINQ